MPEMESVLQGCCWGFVRLAIHLAYFDTESRCPLANWSGYLFFGRGCPLEPSIVRNPLLERSLYLVERPRQSVGIAILEKDEERFIQSFHHGLSLARPRRPHIG